MPTNNHILVPEKINSTFQIPGGESVRDSIESIERHLLGISLLKDQIKLEKDRLPKLITRLFRKTTLAKIPKLYRKLYWSSPHIAAVVKSTFYKTVGGIAPKVAKDFPYECRVCEAEIIFTCTSWSQKLELDKGQNRELNRRWWRGEKLVCHECSETIEAKDAKANAEWERQCAEEERQNQEYRKYLRTCPYSEFLASDRWKQVRSRTLRRAYYRCQLCNAKATLHVHHRTYEHRGWVHLHPEDLIVLCEDCHAKHHDVLPEFEDGRIEDNDE